MSTFHDGSKLGQLFKVWWMGFWRILFFTAPVDGGTTALFMSFIFAAVLVLGLGRTVRIFPLLQLIFAFRFPFPSLAGSGRYRRPAIRPTPAPARSPRPPAAGGLAIPPGAIAQPKLTQATSKGTMTGFEPRELNRLELQKSPWIAGNPGFGLDSSGFEAASIRSGQEGERNFAKTLQKTGLIDKFQSFWSMAVPDKNALVASTTHSSDIDCVLFNGTTVYLVDLKNYKGGAVTYSMERGTLVCHDDATGQPIEVSSKLSQNMSMAGDLMRKHLEREGYRVEARVVFMPTNSGIGRIRGVRWPGNIPAMYVTDFLRELEQAPGFDTSRDHSWLSSRLASLVKRR